MIGPTIGSRTVLACRDTLTAVLSERMTGLHPTDVDCSSAPGTVDVVVDMSQVSAAIKVKSFSSVSASVMPLQVTSMTELHRFAMLGAWRDGAWDLKCSFHGPLSGCEIGLVSAWRDFSEDREIENALVRSAEAGRLCTWLWLPMRDGPPLRLQKHHSKDVTLLEDGSRSGHPPDNMSRPAWHWCGARDWIIRLGVSLAPKRLRRRPLLATQRQRDYLMTLSPRGIDLQPDLTRSAASKMIDALLAARRIV